MTTQSERSPDCEARFQSLALAMGPLPARSGRAKREAARLREPCPLYGRANLPNGLQEWGPSAGKRAAQRRLATGSSAPGPRSDIPGRQLAGSSLWRRLRRCRRVRPRRPTFLSDRSGCLSALGEIILFFTTRSVTFKAETMERSGIDHRRYQLAQAGRS
jgi:hypothetical protein